MKKQSIQNKASRNTRNQDQENHIADRINALAEEGIVTHDEVMSFLTQRIIDFHASKRNSADPLAWWFDALRSMGVPEEKIDRSIEGMSDAAHAFLTGR